MWHRDYVMLMKWKGNYPVELVIVLFREIFVLKELNFILIKGFNQIFKKKWYSLLSDLGNRFIQKRQSAKA